MSRQEPIVALQPFMDIVNSGLVLVTLDDERVFSGKISFEDLIISIAKMSRANEESARKSDRLAQAWQAKRASIGQKKLTARCPSWLRLTTDRSKFEVIEDGLPSSAESSTKPPLESEPTRSSAVSTRQKCRPSRAAAVGRIRRSTRS